MLYIQSYFFKKTLVHTCNIIQATHDEKLDHREYTD